MSPPPIEIDQEWVFCEVPCSTCERERTRRSRIGQRLEPPLPVSYPSESSSINIDRFQQIGTSIAASEESIRSMTAVLDSLEGGEEMPNVGTQETVIIPVEIPDSERVSVFEAMQIRQELLRSLDESTWNAALASLRQSLEPIQYPVRVGAFGGPRRSEIYPRTAGGTPIEWLSPANAREYVEAASSGRLSVKPRPYPETYMNYVIRPTSELDAEAFLLSSGSDGSVESYQISPTSGMQISMRSMYGVMVMYKEYLSNAERRRDYMRAVLRNRRRQNQAAPETPNSWTTKRIEDFSKFLRSVKTSLVSEPQPFLHLPILPHKTLSSRTWGIEIEAVDIAGVGTPKGWQLKSDGSLRPLSVSSRPSRSDAHDVDCQTRINMDNVSANAVYRYCNCGYNRDSDRLSDSSSTSVGEWNSPVLRSFHSRGLKYLTGELEPRRTNESAGIHVHVEASDLTPSQAVQLSILYTALEPLFVHEYYRTERRYCKEVEVSELLSRFEVLRDAKRKGWRANQMRFGARYWTVNLASLASHGTVEFRAMGARYNYEHLIRWAYFCRELVNISKANVPQKVWSSVRTMQDVVVMFSKYGKETPTPEWADDEQAVDVVAELGSENRRVPHIAALRPEQFRSPRVVFDDYTSQEVVMSNPSRIRDDISA